MRILLIEDDVNECNIYKEIATKRTDIGFVAMTNSNVEAMKFFKTYTPEGIILDLELNQGEGTGFDFLEELNKLNLKNRPKIIVTTNICSDSVYEFLHKNNVDFIFYKKQDKYSQEKVINTLLLLGEYTSSKRENTEQNEICGNQISSKINRELDLIGVSNHLQGRRYLYDAIKYVIEEKETSSKITTVQYLAKKYKKNNSTISRAMQNCIIHAWRVSPIEDLTTHYTARINYETGIPTPTEFIYYYADKIRKQL